MFITQSTDGGTLPIKTDGCSLLSGELIDGGRVTSIMDGGH